MGSYPVVLALRFLLELAAWASIGYWGWSEHTGLLRPVLGVGLPLLAMVLWGTFRVDGDPGTAPVPVPGLLRLALELAEFGLAAWMLVDAGHATLGIVFAVVVLLHYAVSYDRIGWLLAR